MATTNADQHGPADAKAANDSGPPLGDWTAPQGTNEDPKQTYFFVPRTLSQQHPEFAEGTKIPFLRPNLGHTLDPDAIYAARANDAYVDFKACVESERSYIRKAIFKAQEITFYRCVQKHPIIILRNFAVEDIKQGNKRAVDCAVERCSTVRPQGQKAFQIDDAVFEGVSRYRITGPTEVLQHLAFMAGPHHHFSVKESHIKGASVAHAYYDEAGARTVAEFACIDKVNSILTSENASQQVTLRGTDISCEQLLQVGLTLQKWGCATTFRTYGTLRVTFPEIVTGDNYKKVKEAFPNMSVFTDTPINAWADGRPRLPRLTKSHAAVTNAQEEGSHVARFCCDTAPHPVMFKKIAEKFNGTLMEIIDDKYNTAPMGCLIKFSPRSWTELATEVNIADYFTINGANWLITPIRSKQRV